MATNATRLKDFSQKKNFSVAVARITANDASFFSAAGSYITSNLPADSIIVGARVFTNVVSDAGAIIVGTTEGGSQILSAGDSTTLGSTGTFTGITSTGTGKQVFVGIAAPVTTGDFFVEIDYVEYTKNTGELTRVQQ